MQRKQEKRLKSDGIILGILFINLLPVIREVNSGLILKIQ